MQPLTFSQALQGYFLAQQARRLSQHTIRNYSKTLYKFQPWLKRDLLVDEITAHMIRDFLAEQTGVSKKTVLGHYNALAAFWSWAVREKIAKEHIVHEVQAPKPEIVNIVPYSEQDFRLMLSSLERSKKYSRPGKRISDHSVPHVERNRAILLLLLDCGLRNDELCHIKIHDLDRRNQRIYIFGKGAIERHVPFSSRTGQALWRYLVTRGEVKANEPLFTLHNGRAFNRYWLYNLIKSIGERAGVTDVTVHRFRHTFAIQYLRNGGDPYTLQRMLGHSSLDITKRYLQIAQTDIEKTHQRASPVDNWAL